MHIGEKIHKFQFEIRFLLILALFPVIVVIAQLYYTYQNISSLYRVEKLITTNLESQQGNIIECIITENEKRARIQAEGIKNNIQHDLLIVYKGDIDQLNRDLDNHDKNSACYKIFKSNIENMFMNVDSFDNRAFVADNEGILVDRDVIELKGKGKARVNKDSRLWKTEIESSANPMVASKAIDMILLKDKHVIYWVSEESAKDKDYQSLNLETIKDDINKNGIMALKSYDILVPVYLPNESSVIHTSDAIHGIPETQKKLIVIQSFNLYDAFMVHDNNFEKLSTTLNLFKNLMRETVYTDIVTLILVVILTFVTFGATIYGAFLLIKWSTNDGNKSELA